MKNKFVQILLLLAALCSPVSVNAQTQPDDEIWYTSTSGRIIPSHPDYFGNTIVSNTYESGKGILKFKSPVTKIGMYTFAECTGLTSVTIPSSVTTIEDYAFWGCSDMASVTIPSSVTTIEDYAFMGCYSLASVTIPSSVTSIGEMAFSSCFNLSKLDFAPESRLARIGASAFRNTAFTLIEIPTSVTSIGQYAFASCNNLKIVFANWTTGSKIPAIDKSVFDKLSLADMYLLVPNGMETEYGLADVWKDFQIKQESYCQIKYTSKDGNEVEINVSAAFGASILYNSCDDNGKGAIMFDGPATCIGASAFKNCQNLKSVIIPSTVTSIGEKAFSDCAYLSNITFDSEPQLETIGESAFSGTDITSIEIPRSVTGIGDCAFASCSKLETVVAGWTEASEIPAINENVFDGLTLSNLYLNVPNGTEDLYKAANVWNSFSFNKLSDYRMVYTTTDKDTISINKYDFGAKILSNTYKNGYGVIQFDGPITRIGDVAFKGCETLASITVPNTVTIIENRAFSGCKELTSITVPSSVTEIGFNAFYDCPSLSEVAFASDSKLGKIGEMAFAATDITQIDIPASVTAIGADAFGCNNLKYVYVNWTDASKIPSISTNTFRSGINLFVPTGTEEIYLAADVWKDFQIKQQGYYQIIYQSSDGNIVTPNVSDGFGASIISNAYIGGNGYLRFDGPVTMIGEESFNFCPTLTSITIPGTVKSIGGSAFYGSDLTSINIPDSVTSIGECAFYNCMSMTSVVIPSSVTFIGEAAFLNCLSLPVENNMRYVGDRYLIGVADKALSSYSIKDGIKIIGALVFQQCDNLESFTIPASVEKIESRAFERCANLKSVTISASVDTIGRRAFQYCSNLEIVICESDTPPFLSESNAFLGCDKLKIYVPSVDEYKESSSWEKYKDIIFPIDIDKFIAEAQAKIEEALENAVGITPEDSLAIDSLQGIISSSDLAHISEIIKAREAAIAIITLRVNKCNAIAAITTALQGVDGLTEADSQAIADCINAINNATDVSVIDTQKDKALDIIYLQKAKNDAFDTIDSLVGDVKDAAILTIANGYKDDISKATTPEQVTDIISRIADLETALNYYNTGKAAGQVEALSNLPTEGTTGPAVKITKGEKHITLFNPDKVEFIKVLE